jgi:hypothetical protein
VSFRRQVLEMGVRVGGGFQLPRPLSPSELAVRSEHLSENEVLTTPILWHPCGAAWGETAENAFAGPCWVWTFSQLVQGEIGGADGI